MSGPPPDELRRGLQGRYAGVASRTAAFVVDVVVITVLFSLASAVVERMLALVLGEDVDLADSQLASGVALVAWAFVYCAYPLAAAGRTPGMSVLGLRAVRADGGRLGSWAAVLRVATFPLSFLLAGLPFVLIVLRRDHRGVHDLLSGAAVVYAWPARAAHLRFLVRDVSDTAPTPLVRP